MRDNIFECEVLKGKGILCVLGSSGDTRIIWNKKNSDEVENAKRTFDELVGKKKFAAFSISKLGRRSKKVTEFDPKIQKLILIPPMSGGALSGGSFATEVCASNIGTQASAPEEKLSYEKNANAEIKAMTLLKKKIREEAFIKLVALGYIEVKGKYGLYKVNDNTVILERFDKIGKKIRPLFYTLCINTSKKIGYIPLADKILSLYLSIKENEDKFIDIANFRNVSTSDEFQERGETIG